MTLPAQEPTFEDIYDRLTPDQQKAAFFLLFGTVQFYADGDTWFATSIIADPPAGAITSDFRHCEDLDRDAPGARARLAFGYVQRMLERAAGMR